MGRCHLRRLHDLLVGGIKPSVPDIFHNCSRKQMRILKHHGNVAAQLVPLNMADINAVDSNIFATEKQLKEYGDKLPADKKAAIETALGKLKEAHKNADVAAIDTALAELNAAWQAASQDIYAAQQQQGGAQQGAPHADAGAGTNGQQQGGSNQPEDVEFEEVK